MAGTVYGKLPLHLCQGNLNLLTANLKALLVDSSYTLDVHNHEFLFDIGPSQVPWTGTGYIENGVPLVNRTLTYDPVLRTTKLDADDVAFGALTLSNLAGLIIYNDAGTPQASHLVAHHSISPQTVSGEAFTYLWHADGALTLTV